MQIAARLRAQVRGRVGLPITVGVARTKFLAKVARHPVQFLRSAGLHLLSALGPLRGIVMREGIEPGGSFKALRDSLRERVARKQA